MRARLTLPRESDFTSRLRGPVVAARVGFWLGISFLLCFGTGLLSHEAQSPDPFLALPPRPVWVYRLTQGVHVLSGTAAIPLLLVKLWSVYPRLFARSPRALRALVLTALERGSIGALVAAALVELATGLANVAQWYPWTFSFRATHYALAWIAVGAMAVHVAIKLPVIRDALSTPLEATDADAWGERGLTRRGLVRGALLSSGVAVLATSGGTVPGLDRIAVLSVRSGRGPQGVPVNKSAAAAGVIERARAEDYRLELIVAGASRSLSLAELRALTQYTVTLPIACVEGWSTSAEWSGVRVRDLLALIGVDPASTLSVTSLQQHGPFRRTVLPARFAADPFTLVALDLHGEPLALDHGFPCRLIAPNRPGVLQTKWLARVEVLR